MCKHRYCLQESPSNEQPWSGLVGLTSLTISVQYIGRYLAKLSVLTNLDSLIVRDDGKQEHVGPPHAPCLAFLAQLPRLRDLHISSTGFHVCPDRWALAPVLGLTGLTRLAIRGFAGARTELQRLSSLTRLRHLALGCHDDWELPEGMLTGLSELQSLALVGLVGRRLQCLDLSGQAALTRLYCDTAQSLAWTAALRGLQSLDVHWSDEAHPQDLLGASPAALQPIAALTALTRLVLRNGMPPEGGSGLAPLTALPALRELFLLKWQFFGAADVWTQVAQLTAVTALGFCGWSDSGTLAKGLSALQGMPQLRVLNWGNLCGFAEEAAQTGAALRAALPLCSVRCTGTLEPIALDPIKMVDYDELI